MSIERMKKQAKRISKLMPEYLAKYKDPAALHACQELVAQSNGYPSFHAAVMKFAEQGGEDTHPSRDSDS